jgi:RNA polymerase primary sigma factor
MTQDIHKQLHNESLSPAQLRKYKKIKEEIIGEVRSLRLNQARIDALVEQLYDINKRLVGYEGRLMRVWPKYWSGLLSSAVIATASRPSSARPIAQPKRSRN